MDGVQDQFVGIFAYQGTCSMDDLGSHVMRRRSRGTLMFLFAFVSISSAGDEY